MITLDLAIRSLWNRRGTAALTIASIAISVALLLSVQLLRTATREGFENTLSGTDLVVGARSGPINLLLYSVFRIGDATANVSWASYQKIATHPDVAWTIPISLGDTHRGYRVLGTNGDYFAHYRFANDRGLRFDTGRPFSDPRDAVLGSDVAQALHYRLGNTLILSHGLGVVSFSPHQDHPFQVVGILERTGTPVDRTVHVSIEAITSIHGHQAQALPTLIPDASLSAFLVGMHSRVDALTMQRAINDYRPEALLAILPGAVLRQLWEVVGIGDRILLCVAAFVVFAGLLGMLTSILTSLNERRREMAILRSVGARPQHVFALMMTEAGVLAVLGAACGTALAYALLFAAQPLLQRQLGIHLAAQAPGPATLSILLLVVVAAMLAGLIPAVRAYRHTVSDGLQMRV